MADHADLIAWQAWCAARRKALAAPDSWLGLAGLFWLDPGQNPVGSADDCVVRLPAGPGRLGTIDYRAGDEPRLLWRPAAEAQVEVSGSAPGGSAAVLLQSDAGGAPSVLAFGELRFFVIERDGRLAVRVKDQGWAARTPFAGLEYFAFDPAWVIGAGWEDLPAPLRIEVPSITGELKPVTLTHRAVFSHAGQTVSLLPLSVGDDGVFFVFRDAGSGRATYGGGRFMNSAPPFGGRIRLDFNRAYNPPCAFSPFATCPLPPSENWLQFAVPAGEKKYAGGH
jgi:uncharacterized protein